MGAVRLAFRCELRRRWRSWFAVAVLISVVGGMVLAATAAGRRTESAFPQFVAVHGFDADVYAARPLPTLATLPGVSSVAELLGPDNGQPTCSCTHPMNPTDFGVIFASPSARTVFKLVSGRMPDPSAPDQVLASFTLQQEDGVHLGTVIHVPFYSRPQASAFNNATGAPPKPTVPRSPSAWSASQLANSSSLLGQLLRTTSTSHRRSRRTVLRQTALGYVYLVRLRGGAADLARFEMAARALSAARG